MPKNPNGFSRNLEDNQDEDDKSKLEEAKSSEDDDEEDEKPTISLTSIFNSSAKKGESFFTSIFISLSLASNSIFSCGSTP